MGKDGKYYQKREQETSGIEKASDHLTGRAGLALLVSYLHSIDIFPLVNRFFGSIRRYSKRIEIFELFK